MGFVAYTRFCRESGFVVNTRFFGFVLSRLLLRHKGFYSDFVQISAQKLGGWDLCLPSSKRVCNSWDPCFGPYFLIFAYSYLSCCSRYQIRAHLPPWWGLRLCLALQSLQRGDHTSDAGGRKVAPASKKMAAKIFCWVELRKAGPLLACITFGGVC